MGQELFLISRIGTKRVLWPMGLMFAMILAFQYFEFELPYGFSLSSLLSAGKVTITEEGSSLSPAGDPISKTELVADSPLASSINSTASNDKMANYTEVFEEQRDDEFIPEQDHTLKESLELDMDDDADKPSSSGDLIQPVENSTVDESINDGMGGNNQSFDGKDNSLRNDSIGINGTESYISTLGYSNHSGDNFSAPPAVPPTSNIATNTSSHDNSVGSNAPDTSDKLKTSAGEKVEKNTDKSEKTEQLHGDLNVAKNKSASEEKKVPKAPSSGVYTISEMDSLLFESRTANSPIVSVETLSVLMDCLSKNRRTIRLIRFSGVLPELFAGTKMVFSCRSTTATSKITD